MTPNFPYSPLSGRRLKGMDLLADYLWPSRPAASVAVAQNVSETANSTFADNTTAPAAVNTTSYIESVAPTEFMVFMGDFIYADVPAYFGDDKEAYQRLYRRNYNSPSFRKVYERLRTFQKSCPD